MPDLSTVVNMFFGADNNKVLYALIILVTLDYITGVCVAIKDKKLSSSIGAKGIINKVVIFIMVSLSHVVDSYLLSSGVALERITILFYYVAWLCVRFATLTIPQYKYRKLLLIGQVYRMHSLSR